MDRGWKPNVETSPNCPRCGSSNTKFCYYNNYSLTQPRYFCKGCRRYWTKGGSLRNVPVGGGCRKNRRGKSVRLSTDAASVYTKSLAQGVGGNGSVGHAYGSKGNSLVESTSDSSTIQDGSHIDLALVYANFLNQQPDTNKSSIGASETMPELPTERDPSLDLSSTACTTLDSTFQLLPEENGLVGSLALAELSLQTHFREDDQMYYSLFDSVHHKHYQEGIQIFSSHNTISHNTRAFPPLPSEEMNPQDMLWLNSQMMVNHSIQTTQAPMPGPEAVEDPNLLFTNWSPFDFSSDDTFSKTREI